MVEELMETNAGCELPCWWGIVPSETTWKEARAFLSTIATSFFKGDLYRNKIVFLYLVEFPIPENMELPKTLEGYYPVSFYINKSNGIVDLIFTGKKFIMSNLLEVFGKPDQILFRSEGLPAVGPPQYDLTMIYTKKGIAAHTEGFGTLIEGEEPIIKFCIKDFDLDPFLGFFFWLPGNREILDEVVIPMITGFTPPGPFVRERQILPLEEVTNFDIDAFYSTFSDPDATDCIEAPLGIWP